MNRKYHSCHASAACRVPLQIGSSALPQTLAGARSRHGLPRWWAMGVGHSTGEEGNRSWQSSQGWALLGESGLIWRDLGFSRHDAPHLVSQRYYPQQIAIMGWNYPFSDRVIGELTSSGAKKMGRKDLGDSCGCSMGGWHWEMTNRFPWM